MQTRRFWLITLFASLILCGLGLGELMIRRQTAANYYLLNKSVACTAILLITYSFIISALHAFRNVPKRLLVYRRYAGLVGFGYAVIHIVLTLITPDPSAPSSYKFPFPDYFVERPVAFIAALLGFSIFCYTFWLSVRPHRFNGTPAKARAWRKKLRYGYVGVLFILVHMATLKFEGWVTWIQTRSPSLPPLSLIVVSLLISMVILKILHLKKERRIFETRLPEKAVSVYPPLGESESRRKASTEPRSS